MVGTVDCETNQARTVSAVAGFIFSGLAMALRMMPPAIATLDTRAAMPAPKIADPFYQSAAWRTLVASIIAARGPYCEDAGHDAKRPRGPGIRLFGDHIRERKDGGAELDPQNILLRCGACHTRKTIAERASRMARRARPGPAPR